MTSVFICSPRQLATKAYMHMPGTHQDQFSSKLLAQAQGFQGLARLANAANGLVEGPCSMVLLPPALSVLGERMNRK